MDSVRVKPETPPVVLFSMIASDKGLTLQWLDEFKGNGVLGNTILKSNPESYISREKNAFNPVLLNKNVSFILPFVGE